MSEGKIPRPFPSHLRGREIDAGDLKAFAHPLRMRMHQWLTDHGAATASMLAAELGESTGQTSYHLRQLERHGFVQEDPARGTRRERWWQSVGFSSLAMLLDDQPGATAPALLMHHAQIDHLTDTLRRWVAQQPTEGEQWRTVSLWDSTTAELTAAELADLNAALGGVRREHVDAAVTRREAGETGGRRRVRVLVHTFPLPGGETEAGG